MAYQFKCDKILLAIKELGTWEKRKHDLGKNLLVLRNVKGTNKSKELKKVNRQIKYYDSLNKDMKKEFKPSSISDFFSSISFL
jgi:hypothetical protein